MGNRVSFFLDRQIVTPSRPRYFLTEVKLNSQYSGGDKIRYFTRSCEVLAPQNVSVEDF
jgi:hypothetical protein